MMERLLKRGLCTFELKVIALVCMTFDHVAFFLSPALPIPWWFRLIGRIAAPLFIFLSCWGFDYTHDRVRYIRRMFCWSVGMDLCTAVINFLTAGRAEVRIDNHIFSTLFYILYYLYWIERLRARETGRSRPVKPLLAIALPFLLPPAASLLLAMLTANLGKGPLRSLLLGVLSALLPCPLFVEGGVLLVAFGVILYYLRNRRRGMIIFYCVFSLLTGGLQSFMILALPLLLLYNHRQGRRMKYFFYLYYPLHAYLLYGLQLLLLARGA
ncbi:TraX family protein [Provencibacterium massiliense]|uniref:TraX family protein n=1 Tax=Provencibacterium massiliense TaxID=1841868 RepID=UPI0013565429|nr:TraX family protein [Provencibacterium massiliense]